MKLIPLSEIFIAENRQRKDFDPEALADLGNDIAKNGLYHPIVVRQQGNQTFLVAGERRLRAISQLEDLGISYTYAGEKVEVGVIPCTDIGELPPLVAEEIELHENIKRQELTWQERVDAEARLVELLGKKAAAEGKPKPSLTSIAKEINEAASTSAASDLQSSVSLAKHLHDPDVRKAKSKSEAYKIVERKRREEYDAKIAQEMGRKASTDRCKLIVGDSFEEMLKLPSGIFDVVLCDPPYYIGADSMGEQANANGRHFDDSKELFYPQMTKLAKYTFNLCKDQAHTFVFCSIERWAELVGIFALEGWSPWPRPLIWYKGNVGALPRPQHGPRYTYEAILFCSKGGRQVYDNGHDVLAISGLQTRVHPDEKPVSLYEELLTRVTRPGDAVLDPFCGSGTIFPAANRRTLFAVGIEGVESYAGLALRRLESQQ